MEKEYIRENIRSKYSILRDEYGFHIYALIDTSKVNSHCEIIEIEMDLLKQGYIICKTIQLDGPERLILLAQPCCDTNDCPNTCKYHEEDCK